LFWVLFYEDLKRWRCEDWYEGWRWRDEWWICIALGFIFSDFFYFFFYLFILENDFVAF